MEMPATAATAHLLSCCSLPPNPPNFHRNVDHQRNLTTLSLSTTHSKIPIRDFSSLTPRSFVNPNSNQSRIHPLFLHFLPSIDYKDSNNHNPEPRDQKLPRGDEQKEFKNDLDRRVHFTNMWWADVKAALGQRINLEAIYSTFVFVKDPKLALPHVSIPDLRSIDWGELRRRGFKGVVFDKDNTITAPYCLTPWPPLASSLELCKLEFGPDIAIFSNSTGKCSIKLVQYWICMVLPPGQFIRSKRLFLINRPEVVFISCEGTYTSKIESCYQNRHGS